MSIEELERRYTRLLRWYPPPDRTRLADELLGTVAESARPGQLRPTAREATALVLGGLRARARSSGPRRARESWAHGLQVAVVVALLLQAVSFGHAWQRDGSPAHALIGLLSLAAVPLVHRGRFVPALVPVLITAVIPAEITPWTVVIAAGAGIAVLSAALRSVAALGILIGAAAVQAVTDPFTAASGDGSLNPFLPGLALAALATVLRPERERRSAWWLLTVIPFPALRATDAWHLSAHVFGESTSDAPARYAMDATLTGLGLTVVVAALAWAVVDPRAVMAITWLFGMTVTGNLTQLAWIPADGEPVNLLLFIALGAIPLTLLAGAGAWGARAQARL